MAPASLLLLRIHVKVWQELQGQCSEHGCRCENAVRVVYHLRAPGGVGGTARGGHRGA